MGIPIARFAFTPPDEEAFLCPTTVPASHSTFAPIQIGIKFAIKTMPSQSCNQNTCGSSQLPTSRLRACQASNKACRQIQLRRKASASRSSNPATCQKSLTQSHPSPRRKGRIGSDEISIGICSDREWSHILLQCFHEPTPRIHAMAPFKIDRKF